jgi:hypothetical protein
VARHSEEGVMKAKWSSLDQSAMMYKPLRLTEEDVHLIQAGLSSRAPQLVTAALIHNIH